MKLIRILVILSLTTYYLLPTTPTYAAVNICDYFPPCAYFNKPADLVNTIIPVVTSIASIIFFVLLIVAGFQLIMHAGAGDPKELGKWRATFSAAIIGLIIMFSAYWIVQIAQSVTGVKIGF